MKILRWLAVAVGVGLTAASAQSQGYDWPTLAATVAKLGMDAEGLPADLLGRKIEGTAQTDADGVAVVAYHVIEGDGVSVEVYVALHQPGARWRQVALTDPPEPAGGFGNVQEIRLTSDLILIDTHLTPSAGNLIVIKRPGLALMTTLYGWLETVLPTGLIVYTRSMMHWAPAHPAELWAFDPRTRRNARLYPTNYHSPARRAFVDMLRPIFEGAKKANPDDPYGWDPEWYDVTERHLEYVPATDSLRFDVEFSSDRVLNATLTETYRVNCRPMKSTSRTCVESR